MALTLLASNLPGNTEPAQASAAATATYSATQTIPVPPSSSYTSPGGGDGWADALTSTDVFNIFHYYGVVTVSCHHQVDGSACYDPNQVHDANGVYYASSGQPGLWIDPATDKLYTFATRTDSTAGVLCYDTALAGQGTDPFCGFTTLTAAGEASITGSSDIGTTARVGSRVYAFNFVYGQPAGGAVNRLLCFDTATLKACPNQPYSVSFSPDPNESVMSTTPEPVMAAIGNELVIPLSLRARDVLACFDVRTGSTCAGSWPLPVARYGDGGPYPMLDPRGATIGFCLPTGATSCFDLTGSTLAPPQGLVSTIGRTMVWNGPSFVLGPRVYVPNGYANDVECYDFASQQGCPNFRGFSRTLSGSIRSMLTPSAQRASG